MSYLSEGNAVTDIHFEWALGFSVFHICIIYCAFLFKSVFCVLPGGETNLPSSTHAALFTRNGLFSEVGDFFF